MSFAEQLRSGQGELVAKQIKPSDLRQTDEAGVPLIHLFAIQKQLGLVVDILNTETLETTWATGWTVAHTAAAAGDAEALRPILKKNKHLLFWRDQHGQTPLHLAALHNSLTQFDVEPLHLVIRDNLFTTAMHYAAVSGRLHQIADHITPQMLLMLNWQEESVLVLLNKVKQEITPSLKDVVWETEFLTEPQKRTWANVMQHVGITR